MPLTIWDDGYGAGQADAELEAEDARGHLLHLLARVREALLGVYGEDDPVYDEWLATTVGDPEGVAVFVEEQVAPDLKRLRDRIAALAETGDGGAAVVEWWLHQRDETLAELAESERARQELYEQAVAAWNEIAELEDRLERQGGK